MAFTAQNVKELRERTGCGMMDCKAVLVQADGDMEKAAELLREKGLAAAEKKAGRIASEGMVYALADTNKKVGALVEVNSETDFVAKNESFQLFVKDITNIIINNNPADVDALMSCKAPSGKAVSEELQEKILVIGENLKIRRFCRFNGVCCAYVHGGGTHGVLVKFDTTDEIAQKPAFVAYAKDVAMHIAAMNPGYVNEADVPDDVIAKEKEILKAQAINEGKPESIAEKMVIGRIKKYYESNVLVDQKFVKNGDISVGEYTKQAEIELGGSIKITQFARFEKGEGLEKKNEDFAAEIAGMVN